MVFENPTPVDVRIVLQSLKKKVFEEDHSGNFERVKALKRAEKNLKMPSR